MVHSGHHIMRGWRREQFVVRVILSALLPALFLFVSVFFFHLSLFPLLSVLGASLWRVAVAYSISLVLGVLIALWVGSMPGAGERWIAVFDVAQNIPSFALIPLFVLAMGYSNAMIIIFAATSIIWPIVFSTLNAVLIAHPSLNEAATLFGAYGWRRIVYYLLPLAYPAILSGSIVGVSMGWESVIGAEIIGSVPGIGLYLNNASAHANTALLIAGLSALLLLVFIINRVVWSPLLRRTYAYSE